MSGKTYLLSKNYHKHNYFDAFKYIVPGYIYDDDIEHSPKVDDLVDVIINSNINLANNISDVISISSIEDSASENLDNISGIVPYFIKQNRLTDITSQDFEDKILFQLDKTFRDFETIESFSGYVVSSLLPTITLNNPSGFSSTDTSNSHNYLIGTLSWLYFLNTSGDSYDPSAYVADLLVNKLYKGDRVTTADGIKGLMEYTWKNNLTSYYPTNYFSSGTRSDLSGTQQLDKLKTWIDIIYSPLYADSSDFRVRDKFETFIESNIITTRKVEDGPFVRFLRALSFLAYDIDNLSEKISTIYDLEDCPDDYLPLLAKMIGWDLFGTDPDKWRLQLRNATEIYKSIGTKKSIQFSLNTVFPKDQFPIQTSLVELWESYVPYLIYYSLATESSYFKDYTTWTPQLAIDMNVSGYTASSMDANLQMATDRLIEEIYQKFPDSFNIPNLENGFYYRGNTHRIPPYEEYPYYVNVELSKEMIDFIVDRLVCFGVRNEFAIDVSSYLTEYGLDSNDEPRDGSWLLFTSGYNQPPNFSKMIKEANNNKASYLSMWSGKSSHFKLSVNASAYDFTRKGLITTDTGDAIVIASNMVRKFAPAHSIPLVSLNISGSYDQLNVDDPLHLPLVLINPKEYTLGNSNYWTQGLNINSYKRGINITGNVVSREDTQIATSPLLLNAASPSNLERRSLRRRNIKNVLPINTYYDRTGFNMPTTFEMDYTLSGLPLGYIPTRGTYVPVSSHVNLPDVWDQCEGLTSKNSYNDYAVSNTMAARGRLFHPSSVTNNRDQLPNIYASMHKISERYKVERAWVENGPPRLVELIRQLEAQGKFTEELENALDELNLLPSSFWTNKANLGHNQNTPGYTFPETVDSYYNFSFGRDLSRLYRIYTEEFSQHKLSPTVMNLDGANIISHTYGPLLYNHDFNLLQSGIESILTSSISNVKELIPGQYPFTNTDAYVADDTSDMYVERPELVYSSLVKGVDLIHTSGTDDGSVFSVFRVDSNVKKEGDDPYMFDRTFILTKAGEQSMPRVRMDISRWDADSNFPLSKNFLLPNHDYQLDLKALVGDDTGRSLGGRQIGIWIHTRPEDGKVWSYTQDGAWVQHEAILTRNNLVNKYAHLFNYPSKVKPKDNRVSQFECLDFVAKEIKSPVTKYKKDDFLSYSINFNTRNLKLLEPIDYKQNVGDLHRKNQNYVVEVFLVPSFGNTEQFLVFDELFIKDLTLKKLSEIYVSGPKNDPLLQLKPPRYKGVEYRAPIKKEELLSIFKYFNKLAGKGQTTSYASRDATKTETIMGTDGGSKLDYRYKLDWFGPYTQQNNIVREITIDI